jgi:eukaryotic-like serine/threonine-protein kinase
MAVSPHDDGAAAADCVMGARIWPRVKDVVAAALETPPGDREVCLRRLCGDDRDLQSEAGSLLSAIEHAGTFLERPPRMLEPGDAVGPYEVLEFLGAGGMGQVYRARDSRLNREVALKVRSEAVGPDSERFARFTREAQVLASLNHPHIAAIYGFEEADGIQALVLELVAGTTLVDRIGGSPIPVPEALAIAKQIADGLEAAHNRGIVHRDLKPANITVRADGTVKILDFGVAKALDGSYGAGESAPGCLDTSGTTTSSSALAGTAAYMSPEQALGLGVDTRSDIWAFGCVLYEMLTGRQAFGGGTAQEALAAVLTADPDWDAIRADVPADVGRLLRGCLEKDRDRRLLDMAAVHAAIEDAARASAGATGRRARLVMWTLTALAAAAVVGAAWLRYAAQTAAPPAAPNIRRLLIGLPDGRPLARAASMPLGVGHGSLAIAPDGTRVVYVMERDGVTQLFLRALDALEADPIPNTEGAFGPFFSPDGKWIGFFARNRLQKVAVGGGAPIDLAAASNPYGGSWGTDGTILFAADEGRRPTRIRDTGGAAERIAMRDDRGSWTRPDLLPGGKAAIVSHAMNVGVLSLATGEYRTLVENAGDGRYAPSGHLIFARAGVLLAAPFDPARLVITGPPAVVLEDVRMEGQRIVAQAAFSQDGTLIYVPGAAANSATRPIWVDRGGAVEPVGMPPRTYRSFSLSPDGTRLAIVVSDPGNDIWVQDLIRGTSMRLTSRGNNVQPIWTPDGSRIVFTERTDGGATPFWVPADGTGVPEPIFARDHRGGVFSVSPSGDLAAFHSRGGVTGMDLFVRPLNPVERAQPFLRTPFTEVGPRFSPDGRWIAYASDESGQYEVYVRPYPPGPGKWQVSTDGGEEGIWSRDGTELFYRNGSRWMAAPVTLAPGFRSGVPQRLFEGPYVNVGGMSYDVTRDGRRFLLLQPASERAPVTHLNVVLNWFEQVKQKTEPSANRSR